MHQPSRHEKEMVAAKTTKFLFSNFFFFNNNDYVPETLET